MPTTSQKILYGLLLFNATLVIMDLTGTRQTLWDYSTKKPMATLTFLNENTTNFQETHHKEFTHQNLTKDLASLHPFDRLSKRLEQFNWDPKRIDEVIRKFWKTDKTFLEYFEDEKTKENRTVLSTSCLHTAAWIVVGLLEMQPRPNSYLGLYKLPTKKDLIVYNNTQKPPSTVAAPVIESLRNFVNSRPADEPILLQVDMYQLQNKTVVNTYIDHHFAIHIYNGQISLYQGWQDYFSLIDWMREPWSFKSRYPMPLETFLGHFEVFLTHTEEDNARRRRLEETWKIFGITETFVYGRKEVLDPVVRALRYPWVVSLITHWPSPSEPTVMPLDAQIKRL